MRKIKLTKIQWMDEQAKRHDIWILALSKLFFCLGRFFFGMAKCGVFHVLFLLCVLYTADWKLCVFHCFFSPVHGIFRKNCMPSARPLLALSFPTFKHRKTPFSAVINRLTEWLAHVFPMIPLWLRMRFVFISITSDSTWCFALANEGKGKFQLFHTIDRLIASLRNAFSPMQCVLHSAL